MVSVSRLFFQYVRNCVVFSNFSFAFSFSSSSTVFAGYRSGYEWWESIIMFRKCCFVMLSVFLGVYGATPQVRNY